MAKDQDLQASKGKPQAARALSSLGGSTRSLEDKQQPKAKPYSISEEDLPPALKEQLNQLEDFWISSENPERREEPIQEKTYRTYRKHLLSFLGWLTHIRATDLQKINLEHLTDQTLLAEFVSWGMEERGNSHGWALNVAQAVTLIMEWCVRTKGKSSLGATQLRGYIALLRQQYNADLAAKKVQRSSSEGEETKLTSELCQRITEYLRQDCVEIQSGSKKRSEIALLRS